MDQGSDKAEAARSFDRALAEFRAGRPEAALDSIDAAIAAAPGWSTAHANRGVILRALGRPEAALESYDRAIALDPGAAMSHGNRANVLMQLERWGEALAAFDAALARGAGSTSLHNGRGVALLRLGRADHAADSFAAAAAAQPDWAEAHANHGIALRAAGRPEAALESYARALALRPGSPDFTHNWLSAFLDLHPPAAVLAEVEGRLAAAPQDPALLSARGVVLQAVGRPAEAIDSFDAALARWPGGPADFTLSQRGLSRLALGQFEAGWRDYEHRWRAPGFLRGSDLPPALRQRLVLWPTPQALAGRDVLLVAEQGVGDVLMFAGMVPEVLAIAARVSIRCEQRLARLFAAAFPGLAAVGPTAAASPATVVVALGSLGAAFRNAPEDFPGRPYLAPSAEARARAAQLLGPKAGRRIGLSWRGGAQFTGRSARSIPLAQFAPLLSRPGIEVVSLQHGDHKDEIAAVNAALPRPVRVPPPQALADFDDLAAVVLEMNEVISVQTALIHLAGALGQACTVLVPQAAEWRYGASGESMPWYGSVRIRRRGRDGDWTPLIAELAARLGA